MSKRATDTFWVVVTTDKRPYTLPFTARATRAQTLFAWQEACADEFAVLPSHLRIVRVTATWEVTK